MSGPSPPTAPAPQAKELQFNLRTLLIGVTLTAVLLGALSTYVNAWSGESRRELWTWLGVYAFIMLTTYVYLSRLRSKALQLIGPCLVKGRQNTLAETLLISGGLSLAGFMVLSLILTLELSHVRTEPEVLLAVRLGSCIWPVFIVAWLAAARWRSYAPRVGERGILMGMKKIIPWESIERWSWKQNKFFVAELHSKLGKLVVKVARADRDRLAEVLDRYVSADAADDAA